MVCVGVLYWGTGNSNCNAVLAEKFWYLRNVSGITC